ncbi:MAG: hypothetical protein AB1631_13840 [Acidobacteriota bacterium]
MKELKLEDRTLIRQYLLGALSEDEQARFQDRLLTERDLFDELLIAENELTDDYLSQRLAEGERERFINYFLASPERRQKLRFARALSRHASESRDASTEPRRWKSLFAFFSFQSIKPVWAAILLASFAGLLWLAVETARLRSQLHQSRAALSRAEQRERELEREMAQQRERSDEMARQLEREQGFSDRLEREIASLKGLQADQIPGEITLALLPGAVRDEGAMSKAELPRGATRLRLQLALERSGFASFRAELRTPEGRQVWSRDGLKASQNKEASLVEVRLPAGLLADGDYIITLRGETASGESERAGTYFFRVLRK